MIQNLPIGPEGEGPTQKNMYPVNLCYATGRRCSQVRLLFQACGFLWPRELFLTNGCWWGFYLFLVNTIPPLWLIVCLSSRLVFCHFIRHSSLHMSYTFQRIFLVSRSKRLSVCNVFFSCSFLRAVLNYDIIHNSTSPSLDDFAVFFRDWRGSHQMSTGNVFPVLHNSYQSGDFLTTARDRFVLAGGWSSHLEQSGMWFCPVVKDQMHFVFSSARRVFRTNWTGQ